VPWSAYGADGREAQAALNRPLFANLLTQEWLPAIPDVHRQRGRDSRALRGARHRRRQRSRCSPWRPETMRRYAREPGFDDAVVLDIEHESFRFYRLN
jgi:hypothetical protein